MLANVHRTSASSQAGSEMTSTTGHALGPRPLRIFRSASENAAPSRRRSPSIASLGARGRSASRWRCAQRAGGRFGKRNASGEQTPPLRVRRTWGRPPRPAPFRTKSARPSGRPEAFRRPDEMLANAWGAVRGPERHGSGKPKVFGDRKRMRALRATVRCPPRESGAGRAAVIRTTKPRAVEENESVPKILDPAGRQAFGALGGAASADATAAGTFGSRRLMGPTVCSSMCLSSRARRVATSAFRAMISLLATARVASRSDPTHRAGPRGRAAAGSRPC